MKSVFIFLLTFSMYLTFSQVPGTLDPAFGEQGVVLDDVGVSYYPYSITIQKNYGEIFIAGQVRLPNSTSVNAFVKRYDFYGNPISSFGENGELLFTFDQAETQRIFQIVPVNPNLETHGFFLRGRYYDFEENEIDYVSKHHEDGSLDSSYGNGGILEISGQISGNFIYSLTLNEETGHQNFKRFNLIDGTLDESFANADLALPDSQQHFKSGQYQHINVQDDGKIVLVGYTYVNDDRIATIARFHNDGTIDASFGENGYYFEDFTTYIPSESITQSDGKIIYTKSAGVFTRLNANGTLDASYGTNGTYNLNLGNDLYIYAYNLKIQSDNKIYFNGQFFPDLGNIGYQYIARLNTDGSIDFVHTNFESNGYSEIWNSALVGNSFVLTSGVYFEDADDWKAVLQRIYASTPIISLFGQATGNTDFNLTTDDFITFQGTFNLSEGTLKFRLDHADDFNWGGFFPSGVSTMGTNEILIPENNLYDVTVDLHTGEFSFTEHLSTNEVHDDIVQLFPNPVQNVLNFNKTVSSVKIYHQLGGLVFSSKNSTDFLDVSKLHTGVYTVSFICDGKSFKKQFIKK